MRDRVPAMRHGQVETSWDGDITIWSEKDHKSSLQGPKGDQRETTRRTRGRTRGDRRGTSKETCIFYIPTITSSTNFNDFIFESSCSPLEDGFVGEQRDQSESVSLDKLTGIRFRDIIMTKIENLLYLDYTISQHIDDKILLVGVIG